jgi:hypothetical protein
MLQAATNRHQAWEQAKQNIKLAQGAQKKHYDKGRKDMEFKEGDEVLYSTKNAGLKTTLCRKLLPKWVGPFKILKVINAVAFKLDFPPHLKWHNVVHVSSLRRYIQGRRAPPPLPIIINGEINYMVESILAHQKSGSRKGKPLYKFLIKWEGYDPTHNSWEPESNLVGTCDDLLSVYKSSHNL